jgi:hypothetical protein
LAADRQAKSPDRSHGASHLPRRMLERGPDGGRPPALRAPFHQLPDLRAADSLCDLRRSCSGPWHRPPGRPGSASPSPARGGGSRLRWESPGDQRNTLQVEWRNLERPAVPFDHLGASDRHASGSGSATHSTANPSQARENHRALIRSPKSRNGLIRYGRISSQRERACLPPSRQMSMSPGSTAHPVRQGQRCR